MKRRDQHIIDQPMLDFDGADSPAWEQRERQSIWTSVVEPAIEQADANADEAWRTDASECIAFFAAAGCEFTADDVLERLESTQVTTHNLVALGPRFLAASRAGLIAKTGRMVQSRIPRRHRKITVWIGVQPIDKRK